MDPGYSPLTGRPGIDAIAQERSRLLRLNFYLAWRLLVARKASLFFMVTAVAFGLGFQWPNMANISGYSREMMTRFVEKGLGHYRLFHETETFFDAATAREQLRAVRNLDRVDPRIRRNGLITRVGRRNTASGVVVLGIDKAEWTAIRPGVLAAATIQNQRENANDATGPGAGANDAAGRKQPAREPDAMIGSQLADMIDFKEGDALKILVMRGERPFLRTIRPTVVSEYGYVTERQILLPLADLQKMLRVPGRITELAVLSTPAPMPGDVLFTPDRPYTLRPWWRTIDFARRAIEGNQVLALIASLMTLTGVSIPLLALLYLAVLQDREHVALLSSLGFSRLRLFFIYFMRSTFIALLGCAGGAGIGYASIRYFDENPIYATDAFVIRPVVSFEDLSLSLGVVFGVTLLSGIYPAWRAARLDPVLIFRGIKE